MTTYSGSAAIENDVGPLLNGSPFGDAVFFSEGTWLWTCTYIEAPQPNNTYASRMSLANPDDIHFPSFSFTALGIHGTVSPGGDEESYSGTVTFDATGKITAVTGDVNVPIANGASRVDFSVGYRMIGGCAGPHGAGNHKATEMFWEISGGATPPDPEPDPGDQPDVVDDDDVFIDTLLDTTDKVIRIERLGYGSGSFKVRRDSPDADVVGTGLDGRMVKVTIPRISADPIFRWMIENINVVVADQAEQGGEVLSVAGRGALAYLERAKSSPYTYVVPSGPVEVHQGPAGTGSKPGQILRRIIAESQHVDRPQQPIPLITVDFDYTNDSDGNPWTTVTATAEMNTGYVGESLLVGIEELWGSGEIDIILKPDGGMLLQGFNHYGRDLTGTDFGAGVVRFVKGVNIADRLGRTVGYQLPATHAWVEGDNFTFVDPPAELPGGSAGRPVVETFIRTPGTNLTNLEAVGTAHLVEGLRRGESVAFNVAIVEENGLLDEDAGLYLPGPPGSNGHFWIGDEVTIHTGTGANDFDNETVRIEAITIWFNEANDLKCKVEVKATTLLGRLPPSTGSRTGTGGGSITPGSAGGSTGGTTQGPPPVSSDLNAHITDPTDAHDASAVSYSPTGTISSTDVQAAVAEVSGDVTSHLGDAIDAHDASAISVQDTGGHFTGVNVEDVLAELFGDITGGFTDPMTTRGDMIYRNASNVTDRLAAGSAGAVGMSDGTDVSKVRLNSGIECEIDGGGSAITTGTKGAIRVPHDCTILEATILDINGATVSAVVDIKKRAFGGGAAASICASAKPTLSGASESTDTTLTGWTTTLTAGDILYFNVDSATTTTLLLVYLKVRRSAP